MKQFRHVMQRLRAGRSAVGVLFSMIWLPEQQLPTFQLGSHCTPYEFTN